MFNKLYELTKKQEEINGCPLVICGMFCNTSGNEIDFEFAGIGGEYGFMADNIDLIEVLENAGIEIKSFENALKEVEKNI